MLPRCDHKDRNSAVEVAQIENKASEHISLVEHSANVLNSYLPLIVIQLEHSGSSQRNFLKSALLWAYSLHYWSFDLVALCCPDQITKINNKQADLSFCWRIWKNMQLQLFLKYRMQVLALLQDGTICLVSLLKISEWLNNSWRRSSNLEQKWIPGKNSKFQLHYRVAVYA